MLANSETLDDKTCLLVVKTKSIIILRHGKINLGCLKVIDRKVTVSVKQKKSGLP